MGENFLKFVKILNKYPKFKIKGLTGYQNNVACQEKLDKEDLYQRYLYFFAAEILA